MESPVVPHTAVRVPEAPLLPPPSPLQEAPGVARRFGWGGPLLMLLARLLLALLFQALLAGMFALRGHPRPWEAAAPWFTVYGSRIDAG